MIITKTDSEISVMREGGKILREILHELALKTRIGISTAQLNLMAETLMAKYEVTPSFKGYRGYPAVICTSINEEVVHAIPGDSILNAGDILSIDCGIVYKGFHTDCAVTIMLGNVSKSVKKFVNTAQAALEAGIEAIRPGARIGDIGFSIQQLVESAGYAIVKDFIGHGIGRNLHEEPEVPNFGKKGKGPILLPGMTIAIEPIIAMGTRFVDVKKDNWTAITRDGKIACQVEHTVLITQSGYEVLTRYDNTIKNIYSQ